MNFTRTAFVAALATIVLAAAPFDAARAQFGGAPGQKPPCYDDFIPLRAAVERVGRDGDAVRCRVPACLKLDRI